MKRISWWDGAGLAATVLIIALAALAYFQPDLPGRWCSSGPWLVCYREWLVALSGWAAAIAAAAFIAHERHQASSEERRRARAARMLVVSVLERFALTSDKVVEDIENWDRSDGNFGAGHMKLPEIAVPTEIPEVALLPEAEDLAAFARNINLINDNARGLFEITDPAEVVDHVRIRAASSAVRAYAFRNRLAKQIGWSAIKPHGDRIDQLKAIAKEAGNEDAANVPERID
jgi:hypothetical protein